MLMTAVHKCTRAAAWVEHRQPPLALKREKEKGLAELEGEMIRDMIFHCIHK